MEIRECIYCGQEDYEFCEKCGGCAECCAYENLHCDCGFPFDPERDGICCLGCGCIYTLTEIDGNWKLIYEYCDK